MLKTQLKDLVRNKSYSYDIEYYTYNSTKQKTTFYNNLNMAQSNTPIDNF